MMRSLRYQLRLPVALLIGVVGGSPGAFAKKKPAAGDVVDMAPVLVSTEGGGGPQWHSIAELAAAAEKGIPLACFQYAQLLENGDGDEVPKNPARAMALYEVAAAAGEGESIFRLGKIHHDGLFGVAVDYPKALAYYRRAAIIGVPEATYNVGAMLVSGRGTKRDYAEGLAWLLLAAERGSDPGSIDQVKSRLRNRPKTIAAGEARLITLKAEMGVEANASGSGTTMLSSANGASTSIMPATPVAKAPGLLPVPTPVPAPNVDPIRIAPTTPGIAPAVPQFGAPTISIPIRPPKVVPETPAGEPASG